MSNQQKAMYTFNSPRPQSFSLPTDLISSISTNPSSFKGLLKLYQTCKYFYLKSQILVLNDYVNFYKPKYFKDSKIILCNQKKLLSHLTNLNVSFWFTKGLTLKFVKESLKQFYPCSIYSLNIDHCKLSFADFQFLTAEKKIEKFTFKNSKIIYSDKSHISIDIVIKMLPNIIELRYNSAEERYSKEILKKLCDIHLQRKLEYCSLKYEKLCQTFDPKYLNIFFQQNAAENCVKLFISS